MIDTVCQIMIFVLGTASIFLLAQKSKLQRWGYIVGLAGEIFWFISTVRAKQWGIFALCFIYTACFILGIYNHWIRKEKSVNYTVRTTTYVPPKRKLSYEQLKAKTDKVLKSADELIKRLNL